MNCTLCKAVEKHIPEKNALVKINIDLYVVYDSKDHIANDGYLMYDP